MTTTITVEAHCSSVDTEVEITIMLGPYEVERKIIQDGEKYEDFVYDNRQILVKEVTKK